MGGGVMILAPGIHFNIAPDVYHADPCAIPSLSSSLARVILDQSPYHAWWSHPRLNPEWQSTDSKVFDIGRAAHAAVLGAGGDYVGIPDEILASNGATSTKAAKGFIAEARAAGKTPLKSHEVAQIERMAEITNTKLRDYNINLAAARSEVVVMAEIGNCPVRCMVDNAPDGANSALYDFKTTISANPTACERAVMNYGYDIQAAHYLETWEAATGERRNFRFIFQEKTAPYEVSIVEIGQDSLMMAAKKTKMARAAWADGVINGQWPAYPVGIHRVELPDWYHAKWLERESAAADLAARNRTTNSALQQAHAWQAPTPFYQVSE
jgi:hypothetical protein